MDLFLAAKPRVYVLGCTPTYFLTVSDLLKDFCHVRAASPDYPANRVSDGEPLADLILLDGDLPNQDSHEVCQRLKIDPLTRNIPVVFASDQYTVAHKKAGFSSGATDYLVRPTHPDIFIARLKAHLANSSNADILKSINARLEQEIAQRMHEVTMVQDVMILAMTSLAETRDSETGNHIRRTQHYVYALSQQLRKHPRFAHFLTDRNIDMLFKSAPLHDIGKVGIPDRILLKPGRFEPAEMEIMKTHTTLGRDAIENAEFLLGVKVDFLTMAKEIAYSHQEKWDGSGYPQGLAGDAIPISARLMALADVYDAIISRRVYKDPIPHEKAVHIIQSGKGQHFDPDIVEAFLAITDDFKSIAARFCDSDTDMQKKVDYLALAGAVLD